MDIYLILLYSVYGADTPQQTCKIEGLSQVRSGLDLFAAGSELQNSAGIVLEFAVAEEQSLYLQSQNNSARISEKKPLHTYRHPPDQTSQCQKLFEMRSFLERGSLFSVLVISIHVMSKE